MANDRERLLEQFRRMFGRYPRIFRGRPFIWEHFMAVKRVIDATDPGNITVFYYETEDAIRYAIAAMMSRMDTFPDLAFISIYRLLDIYLDKLEDVEGITSLRHEVLSTYDGPGTPNRLKGALIAQLADQQYMADRKFWLFYQGNRSKLVNTHEDLVPTLNEMFDEVTLPRLSEVRRAPVEVPKPDRRESGTDGVVSNMLGSFDYADDDDLI